jgi:Protein of unknown function (DUF3551)
MIRMLIIAFFVVTALLGETRVSPAQSPYSYPWCAIYGGGDNSGGGAMSCYYASWQQCMTTLSGIGGICVESPYYHPQPTLMPHRASVKVRHRRHT